MAPEDNKERVPLYQICLCNLEHTFRTHFDLDHADAILMNRCVIASSYIKKIYLETFCNATIKLYTEPPMIRMLQQIFDKMTKGGICDMTINRWIGEPTIQNGLFTTLNSKNKEIKIGQLSIILNDSSFFDTILSDINLGISKFESELHPNPTIGIIKKIFTHNNQPYFNFDGRLVKCMAIHFQGARKLCMEEIYKLYFT